MKKQRKSIPIHVLKDRTSIGLDIRYVNYRFFDKQRNIIVEAHRDDHYLFILMEKGDAVFMIDFTEFKITAPALVVILPAQVHQVLSTSEAEGWLFAVDTALLTSGFRKIVEEQWLFDPLQLAREELVMCRNALHLTKQYIEDEHAFPAIQQEVIQSLVSVFGGLVAEFYSKRSSRLSKKGNRSFSILMAFRKALSTHFKERKKASDYANLLCLSTAYLNEVIKSTTGFPVSYWIRNEIIHEAKRLLYYTDLTVKEVALTLGYDDHTYFTRVFTQGTQLAPGQFRRKYRE